MNSRDYIKQKQAIEEEQFKQLAKIINITKHTFTHLTAPYDVKYQLESRYYIGETKVRIDKDTSFFLQYGPVLELKKIEGIYKCQQEIKEEKNIDVDMVYINVTSDSFMLYKLKNPWEYDFEWKLLPKNNYTNEKIYKMVHCLTEPFQIIKK
jgi:hypothetical protein